MDKVKKKQIKRIISLICIVVIVILLAVMPLLASSDAEAEGPVASILSGSVHRGDIESAIKGGGTLAEEEALEITIPQGVMLTEFLVNNGDVVSEGDALASVDRVSVMTAITQVQQALEYLNEEMEDARDEEVSSNVTAQSGGRVKIIYAEAGDSVQDVMLEHGALAVLSLDGLMAVELSSGADISTGEGVLVSFDDGTEVEGVVESSLDGTIIVTIEDEGYEPGTSVYVSTEERRIGSGELYIHNAWKAVGYSGTVSSVNVKPEQTVSSGRSLMTLKDRTFAADFNKLSRQHRQYEELMLELFRLYQSTTVCSTGDGVVAGVDEDSAYLLSDSGEGFFVSLLANAPNGDDEQTYTNFVGQVTLTDDTGWELLINPTSMEITDYLDLSGVNADPAFMTESAVYGGDAPVYELVEGQWQQISASSIAAGDILLFAGDAEGSFVWIVRISSARVEEPTEPTLPSDPTEPTVPEAPEDSSGTVPDGSVVVPNIPGGSVVIPGISGDSFAGIIGGMTEEEEEELYSLEGNTIMTVTAQNTVTISMTLDELDINKIQVGMTADVKLDALRNESFTAVVTEVGTVTDSDGNIGFAAELTMDRGEGMLSGMNATATIVLDTVRSVLTIPVAALVELGNQTVVYTSYDEKNDLLGDAVVVETGVSDGETVQILSGLTEGQTIWYSYYDTLEISDAVESGSRFFG